ncbi:hypothetical protein EIP91_001881 [Steccherinum ochraceum]|uniref:F-box domain-containing protein n=1 Tax=Steccherinum ochraceum TaxID=92696 RepID=A0A4R0RQE0_9APHY|nr:hypothetical protein EIP91_001881 [Steccherinum ochraceum]
MPELWSTIYSCPIVSGVEYAELEHSMERSRGAFLHVQITDGPADEEVDDTISNGTEISLQTEKSGNPRQTRRSALELLGCHHDRIGSLSLTQRVEHMKDVLRVIPLNGPPLVTLNLYNRSLPNLHDDPPLMPDLSASQLLHLSLDGYCLSWPTRPFPTSLVTLQISEWRIFRTIRRRPWQELFDALGNLPQLTALKLSDDTLSPRDESQPFEFPLIKSTISFPRLSFVRLEGNVFAIVYFLEHLVAPPSTRLFLYLKNQFDTAITPRLVTSSTSITHIERTLGPFVLNISPSSFSALGLHTPVPSTTSLPLLSESPLDTAHLRINMMGVDFIDSWDESAAHFHLPELLQMCPYPWVRSARAIHIESNMLFSNKEAWRGLLRSTPHLQYIRAENMNFARAVFPSLLSESEDPNAKLGQDVLRPRTQQTESPILYSDVSGQAPSDGASADWRVVCDVQGA